MNKPEHISYKDWELLNNKYSSKQLEEYFNKNYPYQYLIGNVDFCNNLIKVDERVLIPRYETELLVNEVLNFLKERQIKNLKIVDLCTGSGCIAISLKKEIDCTIDAVDISNQALELAKINALENNVEVNFINRDILKDDKYYEYDVVISNPPYIEETETVGISTKYEPQIALFAKDNGLEFYKKILKYYQAKLYAFEIGYKQKDSIIKIAKEIYPKSRIIAKKDYANFDRYIYIINE